LVSLVAGLRVDDEEVPSSAQAAAQQQGDEAEQERTVRKEAVLEKLLWKPTQKQGTPQDYARAAAVGAHAAGSSPSEVVQAAAKAAMEQSHMENPDMARDEATLAAERALALPMEAKAAGDAAYRLATQRKGRTVSELAAADVAAAVEDKFNETGKGYEAVLAAHEVAMGYEAAYGGTNKGYIWLLPEEPVKPTSPGVAVTQGIYAMWAAFRSGESPGLVVTAAVEACKHAGGTYHDCEDVEAIAADPETFASSKYEYKDAEAIGQAAAAKADSAGWPLQHVAAAAGRAAADAEESNRDQSIGDILNAAKNAATWVMQRQHQDPERVAREAAAEAKKKAEDYGHPDAKVADIAATAAVEAAGKWGARPAMVVKYADDARKTVTIGKGYDTQQWSGRVYTEYDKAMADNAKLKAAVAGIENVVPAEQQSEQVNLSSS
jgi:hypothetical protein